MLTQISVPQTTKRLRNTAVKDRYYLLSNELFQALFLLSTTYCKLLQPKFKCAFEILIYFKEPRVWVGLITDATSRIVF